jgi:hypothetical protein
MVELRVLNSDLKLNKQIDPGRKHNNAHQRARSLAQGISRSNAHLPAKVETQGHRPDKPEMEIAVITTIEIQM